MEVTPDAPSSPREKAWVSETLQPGVNGAQGQGLACGSKLQPPLQVAHFLPKRPCPQRVPVQGGRDQDGCHDNLESEAALPPPTLLSPPRHHPASHQNEALVASEASEVPEKVPPCNQVEAHSASRLAFPSGSGDS